MREYECVSPAVFDNGMDHVLLDLYISTFRVPHPVPAPYRKIEPLKGAAILFWPYKDNKNSLLDTGRNKKKWTFIFQE